MINLVMLFALIYASTVQKVTLQFSLIFTTHHDHYTKVIKSQCTFSCTKDYVYMSTCVLGCLYRGVM